MTAKVTVPVLQAMKGDGRKIVGVVVWDYQMARIVDRAGVDVVSVGDSVGVNLWGHAHPLEVTMDQILIVAQAVRRGVSRALVSVDFPYGPLQEGTDAAVRAAIRLVKEAGVDMVKLDGAAAHVEAVSAITRAGIPVWPQFGLTPQTALHYGFEYGAMSTAAAHIPDSMAAVLVEEARALEASGAAMLDFTNSGPVVGPEVVDAVNIPVVGGFGGGPWLDGRVRMANAAIGYAESNLDEPAITYANVARVAHDAIGAFAEDVRAGRQIRGGVPVPPSD